MLDQCSTVEVLTNAAVSGVSRGGGRRFTVRCEDRPGFAVDDVVFAASGPGTLHSPTAYPDRRPSSPPCAASNFITRGDATHGPDLGRAGEFDYWSFL